MDIIELSVGATVISGGAFLLTYLKKIKNKMKRSVLRNNEE